MILDPSSLSLKDTYKLTIGAIVPRPIAWVSTLNEDGSLNLAPFSYFNAVSSKPLTFMFSVGYYGDGRKKDTLVNIERHPEFVINLTNEATAEAMNRTATTFDYGVSEFDFAEVTPIASDTISVPRVAEAPIAFECKLNQFVTIGEAPTGNVVVFAEAQRIFIQDDLYENGYVLLDRYKPIGRLAGMGYTKVTDLFEMPRLPVSSFK
jgi:flavin reductase (DIM6/NTAB) family NADH-FMN oxidoreductase RutF